MRLEDINFKGKRIGGAEVSKKHANFIINTGNARGSDVKALIDLIRKEVKNKVEAARQEAQAEANQTQNIRKNLSNIKNLQDLLKSNGATMGTGE